MAIQLEARLDYIRCLPILITFVCAHTYITHVVRGQLVVALSLHHVGPEDQVQVINLSSKCDLLVIYT